MSYLSVRRAVLSCVLAGAALLGCVRAADAVPAPLDLGTKDVIGYAVVPDVNALLTEIDAAAQKVAPKKYAPGMVKILLGMALQDPALANLQNKPVVAMVFKLPEDYNPQGGPPPMALFIPCKEAAPYDTVMNNGGVTAFDNGVLIAAPTEDALKTAKAQRAVYDKICDAKMTGTVRAFVSVSGIMETFGSKIAANLKQTEQQAEATMTNEPPPPDLPLTVETAIKIMKIALRATNGAARQVDSLQLELSSKNNAVHLETVLCMKPGSVLAGLFTGAVPEQDKNLPTMVQQGDLGMLFCLDQAALSAGVRKIVAEIAAQPDIADVAQSELVQSLLEGLDAGAGQQVVSVKVGAEGIITDAASTVRDGAKAKKLQENMVKLFSKDGLIGKLYAMRGMKIDGKYDKNVRQRAEVEIDRLSIGLEGPPGAPPEAAAMIKKFSPPQEIATVKNYLFSSTSLEHMDGMVDKASSGNFTPGQFALKSTAEFAPGRQLYFDYDFIGVMGAVMRFTPIGGALKLPAGSPILVSGAFTNGRISTQISIPIAPIGETIKAFQNFRNNIENGAPAQPDPTKDKF